MAAVAEIHLRRRSKVELEVQICEISLISNLVTMGMGAWMGPSTNEKEGSMHHDTQLHIASQLLSALMVNTPSRDMDDREADIRHALDVAAELMRQWGPTTPPVGFNPPPAAGRSLSMPVDRSLPPPEMPESMEQWRSSRINTPMPGPKPKLGRRPGLH